MLAAIDEQIFACKEELSVILGGLIGVGSEGTRIHFISAGGRSEKGWKYETVNYKIDEYTEKMEAFKQRFQEINKGSVKKLHNDIELFMPKLTTLKDKTHAGSTVYHKLISDGLIATNPSILSSWIMFVQEIDQLIQDAENIINSTR